MEQWTQWLDEGNDFDCVYFDFRKAFDTVPFAGLLKKMESYGIDGKLLSWVKSFLYEHKQRVIVNESESEWTSVTSGIPQGSVLGPTLFLIHINDIEGAIYGTIRLFADDTKLYSPANTNLEKIQTYIDTLSSWSDTRLLRFNADKCTTLHYGYNSIFQTVNFFTYNTKVIS